MNLLFYIVLGIIVVLACGLYYWVRHKGEKPTLNTVGSLEKNRQFIEQQKPKL